MARTLLLSGKIGPAFRSQVSMSLPDVEGPVEAIAINEGVTEAGNVLSTLIASVGRTMTGALLYDDTLRTKFHDFAY